MSGAATLGKGYPRVLCVAPAWNEGERITRVVKAVPRDAVETTLVVDDGSTDDTGERAGAAGALLIRNPANRGVGAAIRSGIDYAIEHGYEVVVIISGGGKTPPEQIPRLLEPIIDGRADFAQGSRYIEGGEFLRMPLQRRLGTRAYTLLFSLFCGRSDPSPHSSQRLGLRPREAWTFTALVLVLIGLGVAPRALVDSRFAVSENILRQRQERSLGQRQPEHSRERLDSRVSYEDPGSHTHPHRSRSVRPPRRREGPRARPSAASDGSRR